MRQIFVKPLMRCMHQYGAQSIVSRCFLGFSDKLAENSTPSPSHRKSPLDKSTQLIAGVVKWWIEGLQKSIRHDAA